MRDTLNEGGDIMVNDIKNAENFTTAKEMDNISRDETLELIEKVLDSPLGRLFKLGTQILGTLSPELSLASIAFNSFVAVIENQTKHHNMLVFLRDYIQGCMNIPEIPSEREQEMQELVRVTLAQISKCQRDHQIHEITSVLLSAMSGDKQDFLDAEIYMVAINDLTEREASCLGIIYKYFESCSKESCFFCDYDADFLQMIPQKYRVFLIQRLVGKGLLTSTPTGVEWQDINDMFIDEKDRLQTDEKEQINVTINAYTFYPTELGRNLVRFLIGKEK